MDKIDYPYAVGIGNVKGATYCVIQHTSLDNAMDAAEQEAASNPGIPVYVYAAVMEFKTSAVQCRAVLASDRDGPSATCLVE